MSNEQRYFDALKLIAKGYETPDKLRKLAMSHYGGSALDVIEMAYENIQTTAAQAIKGRRRPKE